MDKRDQKHPNDIIQSTEDDLLIHQNFYSAYEKWNNIVVKESTDLLEIENTLLDNKNQKLQENNVELNNLKNSLRNNTNDYDKLIQMNSEVENEEANLKTEVESVMEQIRELEEAKIKLDNDKELDMLKKMCKASKLLTGTIFHQGDTISGIISTPNDVQNFNLDGAQLKQEDICKKLWQTVAMELGIDE